MQSEQSGNAEGDRPNQLTDSELFLALRAGQTSALGALYDRHAGLVYGLALKVLNNPQEAEDLTQDIFLNLIKASYAPQRGSLRTFLAVLTRSRAIDRVRSRNRAVDFLERARPGMNQEVAANSPFDQAAQAEQSQEVQAALAQLSNEQQQVLRMAYYDGLTQVEIADRLAVPLGTVKARARRGLIKLRQTLTDYVG